MHVDSPQAVGNRGRGSGRLVREQFVPQPRADVFAFFADAFNLERITPAFLRFAIVTPPPIVMAVGTLIEYRLRLHGLPFRWRTRIEAFDPDRSFVDVQLTGPYALWHHLHLFEDAPGGTMVRDQVTYALPFGRAGRVVAGAVVDRTLARIFDHRRDAIARLLPGAAA